VTYHEANKINKEVLGRGLSKQAWGIVQKIREVDAFVVQALYIKVPCKLQ
jgi:predicted RNase H-like nuclease